METTETTVGTTRVPAQTFEAPGHRTYVILPHGTVRRVCQRCSGVGRLREFGHVFEGVCFACGGVGVQGKAFESAEAAVKAAEALERAAVTRRARETAKAQERMLAVETWRAEHAELVTALAPYASPRSGAPTSAWEAWEALKASPVLISLAESSTLTKPQVALATKLLVEQHAAEEARAVKVASSRYGAEIGEKVSVTGIVTFTKPIEGEWGYSLLVTLAGTGESEGVFVKCFSAAASIYEHAEKGAKITITGTVKAHETYEGVKQTVLTRVKAHKEVAA